jgi:hypothetical protein
VSERRPSIDRHRVHGSGRERSLRRRGRAWILVAAVALAVTVVAGGIALVATLDGGGDDDDGDTALPSAGFVVLDEPRVVHAGALPSAEEIELTGRADAAELVVLDVAATASDGSGGVEVSLDCEDRSGAVRLDAAAPGGSAMQMVVATDGEGSAVCLAGDGAVDVRVAVVATLTGDHGVKAGVRELTTDLVAAWTGADGRPPVPGVEVLGEPIVLASSRPDGVTFDGKFQASGLRWAASTWEVPVGRARDGSNAGAALLRLTADGGQIGSVTARSPDASSRPSDGDAPDLWVRADGPSTATAIVPLDASGNVCVTTSVPTHLVVEVLGWFDEGNPDGGEPSSAECPGQTLVPDHLLVAMYGTDRSARLGVLGEQGPEESAARLQELAEPWRAGDRPVVPAFELIATMATSDPGRDRKHRLVSEPAFVQRYLDVARQHGFHLILDIQPGWGDFLSEAKEYESFLRQPDVGLALDPEWKTVPPQPPRGGHIGRVDASEVNAVADWLATLVEEEDLPDKLLVVHQFTEAMVQRPELLREPDGVELVVHMDGFGGRGVKQDTYRNVSVAAPFDNGLKLFFDEDIDMYRPDEVLGGAFDPMPVLVTYQ